MNTSSSPAANSSRRFALRALVGCVALSTAGMPLTWAREGVDVGANSAFSNLVSADSVEHSAGQQYAQMLQQAAAKNALGAKDHPQVVRLRAIASHIIPFAIEWNPRAKNWRWEVNLIGSKQINAFCMPGGKIAFYSGILDQLKLTDNEVAMVMGHEIAHALREHARERMGKSAVTQGAARIGGAVAASLFGINPHITDGCTRRCQPAVPAIQPQRRIRSRSGGHGTRGPRRLRPPGRRHLVAKDERGQQGGSAAMAFHPPFGPYPHCRY